MNPEQIDQTIETLKKLKLVTSALEQLQEDNSIVNVTINKTGKQQPDVFPVSDDLRRILINEYENEQGKLEQRAKGLFV